MKALIIGILAFTSLSMLPGYYQKTTKQDIVYFCDNGKTVVYHTSKDCKAILKCQHTIKEMSLADAKKKGLRKCKLCK